MAIDRSALRGSCPGGYDVVSARGQDVHVDRGEVFENVLLDVSTGEGVGLHVTGASTVIRNVGFAGLYRGDRFPITIDAGPGDVLLENVYLGDGATNGGSGSAHGPGAIGLHNGNEADVTFRRCNVQGFPNNGFHCSSTATSGSVHFDHCFGKNNGVATFRCAGGEDLLEGCVAYTDDTDYGHDGDASLARNGRPVWVWPGGTVTISESHFADGPYPNAIVAGANDAPGRIDFVSGGYRGNIQRATGSTVDVGPDVSTEPDLSIPEGVPTTARAAASSPSARFPSGPCGSAQARFPHVIVFDGSAADDRSSYSFEATAAVSAARRGPIREADIRRGQPVRGTVDGDVDAYRFEGNVEALSVRGDASVSIRYDVYGRTDRRGAAPW